jgi:hypothetical protein
MSGVLDAVKMRVLPQLGYFYIRFLPNLKIGRGTARGSTPRGGTEATTSSRSGTRGSS